MTYVQRISEKIKEYRKELSVQDILTGNMYEWHREAVKRAEAELKEELKDVHS